MANRGVDALRIRPEDGQFDLSKPKPERLKLDSYI